MTLFLAVIATVAHFSTVAHATNPCDADPKYCSDNLAAAAQKASAGAKKSAAALKADQAYQARITALLIKTQDATAKAQNASDKAEEQGYKALDHVQMTLTVKGPISGREMDYWAGVHTSFDLNDRTLLKSLGYFKGVRDCLLGSGRLDEATLTKVEKEVAATAHFIDNAAKAIDGDIAQVKSAGPASK